MINSLEDILSLVSWLEINKYKIELDKYPHAALTLHGKDIIGHDQSIEIGSTGWTTRKTKYIEATIYAGEVVTEKTNLTV